MGVRRKNSGQVSRLPRAAAKSNALERPNLYLIGFMGVGKSAVGRAVARLLGMRFMDSDRAIELLQGRLIREIFEAEGEPAFREMEREFIEKGHPSSGQVIACGGGLPIVPGMPELLLAKGIVVCLFAEPETILRRTLSSNKRPLLQVPDPECKVRELMKIREPIYMKTGIGVTTEGRTISEIVKNVARIYRREARLWSVRKRES